MRITIIFFACTLLFCPILSAQETECYRADPGAGPREHEIDIERQVLELSFLPELGLVSGEVTHYFSPIRPEVDSFFLDGPDIDFKSVKIDGKSVKYRADDNGIHIFPNSRLPWETDHKMTITYEAKPQKGIYFIGWNDSTDRSRKQIWTQGQGIDNRHWIPSFDDPVDKIISENIITFNSEFEVLSNGELKSKKKNRDGTTTWHYAMEKPHANYLIMLAIGKYSIDERKSASGVKIKNYYYPDHKNKLEPSYRYSEQIMDIMEEETGVPYPWGTYSQVPVQDFLYGAMENTSATIFGDFFMVDERAYLDRNYVNVNAHELVHQWFGDYITLKSSEHIWLHESFATHYAKICEREIFGENYFQEERYNELKRALNASSNSTFPLKHTGAGASRVYPKGSLVLDMLKDIVGKDAYDKVINHYLEKHAFGNVTTHQFYLAFHDVLGINLDWFFNQWVLRGGEPHYKVSKHDGEFNGSPHIVAEIEQIHDFEGRLDYFKMPIDFAAHFKDGSVVRKTAWVDGAYTEVKIPNTAGAELDFLVFDEGEKLIKRLDYTRAFNELAAQCRKAENMRDRHEALLALKKHDFESKKGLLLDILQSNEYHLIKSEAAKQLIENQSLEQVESALASALLTGHHKLRRSILSEAKPVGALKHAFEKALNDSSYSNVALALDKLMILHGDNYKEYLGKCKGDRGTGNRVKVKWLKWAAFYEDKKYIATLIDYCGPSYEFRTRLNAMTALKKLEVFNSELAINLINAASSKNGRLSRPAMSFLRKAIESPKNQLIINSLDKGKFQLKNERDLLLKLQY